MIGVGLSCILVSNLPNQPIFEPHPFVPVFNLVGLLSKSMHKITAHNSVGSVKLEVSFFVTLYLIESTRTRSDFAQL